MKITGCCRIHQNEVLVNGKKYFTSDKNQHEELSMQLYRFLKTEYPKFYKMDLLSKMGWLATEIVCQTIPTISKFADDEIALLFANSHSCSESDERFNHSVKVENSPSPSQFVYTLPNILLGELAIRHKWYGENLFTILPEFSAEHFSSHAGIFIPQKAKALFCGWINLFPVTDVFVFFAEANSETSPGILDSKEIEHWYKIIK